MSVGNKINGKCLGNIYGDYHTGYAGNVWSSDYVCPTLKVESGGGGRVPMIIETVTETNNEADEEVNINIKTKKLGNLNGYTGGNFAYMVYDPEGLGPTINTMGGGGREPMIVEKVVEEVEFANNDIDKQQNDKEIIEDINEFIPIKLGKKAIDLSGQCFGRLKVLYPIERKNGSIYYLCQCECGKYTKVVGKDLKNGHTKSCGCLVRENKQALTHGFHGTRLYHIWKGMKQRCNNPNNSKYYLYGGRGITICEEWNEYINFHNWAMNNGYQDDLTIDRIDTNGNYEPSNCRWATYKEQMNNVRYNRIITYKGISLTLIQWSELIGIEEATIGYRLSNGWSVYDALSIKPSLGVNQYTKKELYKERIDIDKLLKEKGIMNDCKLINELVIVASRGRSPLNSSDRTSGIPTEQRLEVNSSGVSNCITTVGKDNWVLEPNKDAKIERVGQISSDGSQCGTVVSENGLMPTISAGTHDYGISHIQTKYRIRKLTPKETWRLMGYSDSDFEKAEAIQSNTALYKQAGNGIVRNCLVAIFGQMFEGKENFYKEFKVEDLKNGKK